MDGIDRSVISPSLINPGWDDLTMFTYNPDFDLGVDADFFCQRSPLLMSTMMEESPLNKANRTLPRNHRQLFNLLMLVAKI